MRPDFKTAKGVSVVGALKCTLPVQYVATQASGANLVLPISSLVIFCPNSKSASIIFNMHFLHTYWHFKRAICTKNNTCLRYCQNFCTLIELKSEIEKLLIAAVIPPLLEKGVDWFLHNQRTIESERVTNPWWRRHTALIEAGEKRSVSELLRTLTELGYTKVWEAAHIGEFSQRGGVIHIFPINEEQPVAIEFEGNYIASIAVTSQDAPISSRLTRPDKPASTRFVGSDASRKSTHLAFVPGDYVVHIDHGIGIFRREEQDDFVIEYAPPPHRPDAPDLLYVPKKEIRRIAPYLGFKKPHISRLGTPLWSLTKKKAKEDIIAFAKELLVALAERKTTTRLPYAPQEVLLQTQ